MTVRLALVGLLLRSVAASAAAPPRELSLEDALALVDRQSPTLAEARARVEESAGLSRQALAKALPTLTASGSYTRNSDQASAPLGALFALLGAKPPYPADLVIQPLDVLSASGTLRVPLFAPTAWAETAAARSSERSAAASSRAARQDLRTSLVEAAFGALAGEEVVTASERAVASAEEQAAVAARALAAGTGVPLAVLEARTEAVRRRQDLLRAESDLERARLSVGVLLGLDEPVRIPLALPAPAPAADPGALAEEAVARRPELAAAQAGVLSAERELQTAHLAVLPELSAQASLFAQNVALPTGKEDGWRVVVELDWPLYDGGLRYGQARKAEGTLGAARAALAANEVKVREEVLDAARDLGVAVEGLSLAEEEVKLAGEAAKVARRGFAAGISGALDVLDANDRLYRAEIGLAEARARLGIAQAALDRAVGRSA
ncbi:MAG TPA: TolC family protein [Anaeromyxobacteraceae bacterium]|nr:TolC family protein [Anaeromyxobacteraceae bacterium]